MFALVESGSITKILKGNKGITIGDNQYPAAIFTIWTEAERKAIGIYDYVEVGAKPDNRFYRQGSSSTSINNSTGTVTITFAKIDRQIKQFNSLSKEDNLRNRVFSKSVRAHR